MDKEIAKEIKEIWDKLDEISRKVSVFYDAKHEESTQGITDSQEAMCDMDETYTQRLADIEEALCELAEITDGGNNNG